MTGNLSHSPEPWRAIVEHGPSGVNVKVVDKNGAVICLCKAAQGNKIENGQFIAAAPAMLIELQRLSDKYGDPQTHEVIGIAKAF